MGSRARKSEAKTKRNEKQNSSTPKSAHALRPGGTAALLLPAAGASLSSHGRPPRAEDSICYCIIVRSSTRDDGQEFFASFITKVGIRFVADASAPSVHARVSLLLLSFLSETHHLDAICPRGGAAERTGKEICLQGENKIVTRRPSRRSRFLLSAPSLLLPSAAPASRIAQGHRPRRAHGLRQERRVAYFS